MFTKRALLEGKWPIGILVVFTVVTVIWCPIPGASVVPLALLAFVIAFFRDPEVVVSADPRDIVAPGSGQIVEIQSVQDPYFLQGEATRVAIFLSVFDVHVQRAPVAGTIKAEGYQPGRFLDVRHPHASAQNEFRWLGIETVDGYRVTVRQIAGLIARRIVGWCGEGAVVTKGERLGMIKFGSRVELFLPAGTEVVVKAGEYAIGGETILAKRT